VYLGLLGIALIAVHLARGLPLLQPRPKSETVTRESDFDRTPVTLGGAFLDANHLNGKDLQPAAQVASRLHFLRRMEFRLRLVPAVDGAGEAATSMEVLEGKQEFLADLLDRLNEIIRKPDGRYMVVYDSETGKPRRILKT
jgi:hypothetical protein